MATYIVQKKAAHACPSNLMSIVNDVCKAKGARFIFFSLSESIAVLVADSGLEQTAITRD